MGRAASCGRCCAASRGRCGCWSGSGGVRAGLLPGWATWSTSHGSSCEIQVDASLRGDGDGELTTRSFTEAEQQAAYEAAQRFLAEFNYESVDRDEAVAEWQAEERRIRAGEESDERQPTLQGNDLEVTAVSTQVVHRPRQPPPFVTTTPGPDRAAANTPGGSGEAPDASDANAVRDAVFRLLPEHREIVMLVHWDGFSISDAAMVLDLNPSTARSHYAAARTTLQNALREPIRS